MLNESRLKPEDVKAKFMGRTGDGEILIEDETIRTGRATTSTIRRTQRERRARSNPISDAPIHAAPGMTCAPCPGSCDAACPMAHRFNENPDAERGLFFMAYNASIAEQFEVIQAWLSGSNSSNQNTYSALRDPFLGVPQDGDPHSFAFYDDSGKEKVVPLPPDKPIVKLEWGLYAFVPSIKAIAELKEIADLAAKITKGTDYHHRKTKETNAPCGSACWRARARRSSPNSARRTVQGFDSASEQWKIALEDIGARMSSASQAVWAAIRELHGGVLRTPYGVLVCSKKLVNDVFDNRAPAIHGDGLCRAHARVLRRDLSGRGR